MYEISVVVDGQRCRCKQQGRNQARYKAEHLSRRAKKQNRDASCQGRRQTQFRFRKVSKCLCTLYSRQRQSKYGQSRTVAILRIVGERLTSEQLTNDVCVNGLICVHGPFTQLRQAQEKSKKRDDEKCSPANPRGMKGGFSYFSQSDAITDNHLGQIGRRIGVVDGQPHTAGLPQTSTSM
jgi:hypothetical protein